MSVLRKSRYEEVASARLPLDGAAVSAATGGTEAKPAAAYSGAWRAAGLVIALGALALFALFHQTAAGAVHTWWGSATYNHGFLILPICGYLVWLRRDRIVRVMPQPDYRGLVLILGCALVWLLANFAGARVVQEFALVGMLQSLVFTVLGWRATRMIAFPLFYLLFAVPAGDSLTPMMQDWTAWFTVWALELAGVPVYLDGIFISIPNGNFEVAEACAGVRFLIATVALGFLYADLTYRTLWRRALFIALSFVVPVVANWLRAFGIVMIAHLTDNQYAVGVDHLIYGWIFFAIVTVLLLLCGMLFREDDLPEPGAPARQAGPDLRASLPRFGFAAVAVVALATTAPVYAAITDAPLHSRAPALALPLPGGGWQPVADTRDPWRPVYPKASTELFGSYQKSGRVVHLYIAYYAHQKQGAEVVGHENTITDGKFWQRASGSMTAAEIDGRKREWEVTRLVRAERRRLVLKIYWVDGSFTGSPYVAKALQAKARLLGHTGAAAALVVAADYGERPAEAEQVIADFLRGLAPVGPILAQPAR